MTWYAIHKEDIPPDSMNAWHEPNALVGYIVVPVDGMGFLACITWTEMWYLFNAMGFLGCIIWTEKVRQQQ